ncbi:MAG: hypothetical protein PHC68_17630 [Syntrophorhabdaceae bacterium]|nr:hypothetical protein [Syntrophorhabdaceae bacterium]
MNIQKPTQDWLDGLKPGDEVAVVDWHFGRVYSIEYTKVLRKTPGGKVILPPHWPGGETRMFRKTGCSTDVGYLTCIVPQSQELTDWMEKTRTVSMLKSMDWDKMPIENLRQIMAIVREDHKHERKDAGN